MNTNLMRSVGAFGRLVLPLLFVSCLPIVGFSQNTGSARAIAQIRGERTKVELYVKEVKKKYQPGTPEYDAARNLYNDAYSKYDGYVTSLKIAIAQGKDKELSKDPDYKANAADAAKASDEFLKYAIDKTTAKKAGPVAVIALVDLGIKIWQGYKAAKDARRAAAAQFVEEQIKWREWDVITVPKRIRRTGRSNRNHSLSLMRQNANLTNFGGRKWIDEDSLMRELRLQFS